MLEIVAVPVGYLQTNCYLVHWDGKTLVLDPGAHPTTIKDALTEKGWTCDLVAVTHGHFDHISNVDSFNMDKVYVSEGDFPALSDPKVNMTANWTHPVAVKTPGEKLHGGEDFFGFEVIETPGHSVGSICLYDARENVLLSGDTLFLGGVGRTDLYGGNTEQLKESVMKLLGLPGETRVYPGHGQSTTIEAERRRFF